MGMKQARTVPRCLTKVCLVQCALTRERKQTRAQAQAQDQAQACVRKQVQVPASMTADVGACEGRCAKRTRPYFARASVHVDTASFEEEEQKSRRELIQVWCWLTCLSSQLCHLKRVMSVRLLHGHGGAAFKVTDGL